jgi:hypothetical protein
MEKRLYVRLQVSHVGIWLGTQQCVNARLVVVTSDEIPGRCGGSVCDWWNGHPRWQVFRACVERRSENSFNLAQLFFENNLHTNRHEMAASRPSLCDLVVLSSNVLPVKLFWSGEIFMHLQSEARISHISHDNACGRFNPQTLMRSMHRMQMAAVTWRQRTLYVYTSSSKWSNYHWQCPTLFSSNNVNNE